MSGLAIWKGGGQFSRDNAGPTFPPLDSRLLHGEARVDFLAGKESDPRDSARLAPNLPICAIVKANKSNLAFP